MRGRRSEGISNSRVAIKHRGTVCVLTVAAMRESRPRCIVETQPCMTKHTLQLHDRFSPRAYGRQLPRVPTNARSPEWGRRLMSKTFNDTVREFIRALMESLPGAAPEDVFWGNNFLTGALTLSLAETGRLDILSDGLCRSTDVAALKARLGPFVAAGLEGLVRRKTPARPDS